MRWLALIALSFVLATPAVPAAARCRVAPGDALTLLVPSGHVAPGGVLSLARLPVYDERRVMTFPITHLTLRASHCTAHCTHRVALRSLAINLYALDVPSTSAPGAYTVVETRSPFEIIAGAVASSPAHAPVLGAAPMQTLRTGSASTQASIDVSGVIPPEAVGLLIHWRSTTWFTPVAAGASGSAPIGPRRCTPDVPGREPIAVGDRIDVSFVGEGGRASPVTTLTSTMDVAGAPAAH